MTRGKLLDNNPTLFICYFLKIHTVIYDGSVVRPYNVS